MSGLLRTAAAGLRARRGRSLLAAAGVLAAALVVGTAATVGYGLSTGFERSAERADLPDVIARFAEEPREEVDERVRALPNLQARAYRREVANVPLAAGGERTRKGSLQVLFGGRRGYAIVAGRDLRAGAGEVVVEQGLAREWGLEPGDELRLFDGFTAPIAGVAVAPDNVAYPLAKTARVYLSADDARPGLRPNVALLWLNDPARADVFLAQARTVSFGIGELSFLTRAGVEVLIGQAAGVVIALLIAFSLVALVAAGTMLAASAHSDVQRRLPGIGVQRALGFSPGRVAAVQAAEAALVALPAAAAGLALGTAVVAGPSAGLLATLNQLPPGGALLGPLALCLLGIVALVVAAATWPAWRAARRPPAEILRGGDLAASRGGRGGGGGAARGGGLAALGVRFATAARARWAASVATVAVCAGIVLLMLALASLLVRLRDDPGTVGKRYQLTVAADASLLPAIRDVDGVEAASERYAADAADAFRLGEPLRLLAYPGDHTEFEAPPLADGRRLRGPGEAEVGLGLADVLGLRPGSTLAVQLAGGSEVRFRVSGIVRALENDGRMAYVRPDRLLEGDPGLAPSVAVRVAPGADKAAVSRELTELGAPPTAVGGAAPDNGAFLGVLAAVLRGVGLAVGLVCLYALVQALAVTARERRGAVALLRAAGADRASVAAVMAGSAAAVAVPAAALAIVLETAVFGPLVARLAAGFATLPLAPDPGQVALVAGGLLVLGAVAAGLVARRIMAEPVVAGLREE